MGGKRPILLLAWLWVACVLGIALLANERLRVIFHVRHLMAVWPALALVCALGVEALARASVRPALVLGLWTLAGLWNTFDPAFMDNQPGQEPALPWGDYSELLNTVQANRQPGDVLLYHVERAGREWLTQPVVDFYTEPLAIKFEQLEEIPGRQENDDYVNAVRRFVGDAPQVWLIAKPGVPSAFQLSEFQRTLANSYAECARVVDAPYLTLDLYARRPAANSERQIDFGPNIALNLLTPLPETADDQLRLVLGWTVGPDVPADTYSYGLHLEDKEGNLVSQLDSGLPTSPFSCAVMNLDLSNLAPGEYGVYALVYNWRTGERVPGRLKNREERDRVRLGTLVVQ